MASVSSTQPLQRIRTSIRLAFGTVLLLAGGLRLFGQLPAPSIPDNGPTPVSPLGIPPHASSAGTNERINPANGSLNVYIPLLTLPQRGGYNLNLGLVHHSNSMSLVQSVSVSSTISTSDGIHLPVDTIRYTDSFRTFDSRLSINLPRLQFSYEYVGDRNFYTAGLVDSVRNVYCASNFLFTDWSGNKHPFENVSACNWHLGGPNAPPIDLSDSSDGSFYRLDTSSLTDLKVYSKDGTVYHFYGFSNLFPDSGSDGHPGGDPGFFEEDYYDKFAALVVDPNGNQITTQTSYSSGAATTVLTDTLGRTISFSPAGLSYTDSDGNPQTIGLASTISSSTASAPVPSCQYWGQIQQSPYVTPTVTTPPEGMAVPASYGATITFPPSAGSGQKQYAITFDESSRLTKIQYPFGGYTRYDYGGQWGQQTIGGVLCSKAVLGGVAHKYECTAADGASCSELTTTYLATPATAIVPYNASFSITDPLGNQETHLFSTESPTRTSPEETDVNIYDSKGVQIRGIHNIYPNPTASSSNGYVFDWLFPTQTITTFYDSSPAVVSSVSYTYEPHALLPYYPTGVIDNATEIDTTDYSGAVIEKVSQQWKPASAFTSSPLILDRLQSRTITDGKASVSSTLTYGYDTSGNITSKTVNGTGTGSLTTHYTRNGYGQIISVTDPKNLTTTIDYADAWSNSGRNCVTANSSSYPTSVTNSAGQKVSYTYNACTGTIATIQDPNGVLSSYDYDASGRVLCEAVVGSDSVLAAKRCNTFTDSAPSTINEDVTQSASQSVTTLTTLDGFGRTIETSLTSDPSGADLIDTVYDPVGRVQSITNPYRSISDPTYGVTSYAYDALGRKTATCHPDNSSTNSQICVPQNDYQSWTYSGNTVKFRDEIGNQWLRRKDVLGRLTAVLEPNGLTSSPSMETDYIYDALGNLRSVTQCGGSCPSSHSTIRTFTYNGLSQLLTSANPETGIVCYGVWSGSSCISGYDSDGNLVARTDARGVVTSYAYDSLNRLLSKQYTGGTNGAQTSCFQYDLSSVPYGIGRLTNQWTQSASSGACAASPPTTGVWTRRTILSYDPLGHILSELQCTPATCSAGSGYTPTYTYDMTGNLLTSTNGVVNTPTVGTLSFTNSFDDSGHLLSVTSNWSDAAHPSSLFSAQSALSQTLLCPQSVADAPYAAFGGLMNAVLGSGITLSRSYDIRQRMKCEMDTGSPTP